MCSASVTASLFSTRDVIESPFQYMCVAAMVVTPLYKHCGGIFCCDLNLQNQLLGMFAKL